MSLKPGIGRPWLDKFQTDVYPHDYVIVNGKEVKPPKYYDKLFKLRSPEEFEEIQFQRELAGRRCFEDNTDARLAVREQVAAARLKHSSFRSQL